MAQVVSGNQVKLSNGQIVNAQQGGWYDGQQFWGGTLSNPGQINSQSNQVGAGQQVSKEVIAQTNPNNVQYIQQQQQKQQQVQPQAPVSSYGNMSMADASSSNGMSSSGAALSVDSTPTLNLPDLYKGLYDKSGISDLEKQLSDSVTRYNDAQAAINDDPFLSEAKRVGRIQKLSTDFDNRVANLKNDIATKKADIETQIQLQTKQFDINSQAAQQEFAKFQALLSMGALDNANGETIAQITRATGLTSDMILAAVNANKQKNRQTSIIQFDDGTNQGFAVIDAATGEIIRQQSVAASKQPAGGAGDYKPGSEAALSTALGEMAGKLQSRANSYGHIAPDAWRVALNAWLAAGFSRDTFIDNFKFYADPERGDFSTAYGFDKSLLRK